MWRSSANLDIKLLEFILAGQQDINNGFPVARLLLDALVSSFEVDAGWKQLGNGIEPLGETGFTLSFVSRSGSHCVFRLYPSVRLLGVEIHELRELDQNLFESPEAVSKLISSICKHFEATTLRNVTSVPRVTPVPRIFFGSMQQLFVYDFDKIVFDADSPYQNVKILHSPSIGNTLVLDDYINLSERDSSYTDALMRKGELCFTGSEVLVLGGGDGALLNEILKENPKFITMIEIDEVVVDACRQHMRSLCGSCLDLYKTQSHEILISDCFPVLEKYKLERKMFDVIFADLTDTPLITDEPSKIGEFWTLANNVLQSSLEILKKGGCFLTHLVGVTNQVMIRDYEKLLRSMNLNYQKSTAFVPSFYEEWVFYMVKK